jgi:hypothetical protein
MLDLLGQDVAWVDAAGNVYPLERMSRIHLGSVLGILRRNAEDLKLLAELETISDPWAEDRKVWTEKAPIDWIEQQPLVVRIKEVLG